ncbi:MAG: hypothetical protein ABEJ43_06085, partial [Haloferacaceae archaeon]
SVVADEVVSDAPSGPTAGAGQEPETPSDPEPVDGTAADTEPASGAEPASTGGSESESEPIPDDDLDDFDGGGFDDDDLYEMDEEERAEAEEFGTEFETGSEVDPAGEADIDVPESEPEPEPDSESASDDGSDDADVDLEDAAVAAMQALDDGDGAAHEAVVARVVEEHGADPEAAEEAVQDALMSGRCYEPDEATLKPI